MGRAGDGTGGAFVVEGFSLPGERSERDTFRHSTDPPLAALAGEAEASHYKLFTTSMIAPNSFATGTGAFAKGAASIS